MPDNGLIIQQTLAEQVIEGVNNKIKEIKQAKEREISEAKKIKERQISEEKRTKEIKEFSRVKHNFRKYLTETLYIILDEEVSLSADELIILDLKFHSSFRVWWRVATYWRHMLVFSFASVLLVPVWWPSIFFSIGLFGSLLFHMAIYDCCNCSCSYTPSCVFFGYWRYRRKLVKLGGEKAIEEAIRKT